MILPAKVRISEKNTKQKSIFVFILKREYLRPKVKGTNKNEESFCGGSKFFILHSSFFINFFTFAPQKEYQAI